MPKKTLLFTIILVLAVLLAILVSACQPTLTPPTATLTSLATRSPNLTQTPTLTVSPTATPVPAGIFPLLYDFYQPLVMGYDITQWEDMTLYDAPIPMQSHALQSLKLASCRIGVQGATEFNDPSAYKSEAIKLANVSYEVKIFPANTEEIVIAYYLEKHSIGGFNYENGVPLLAVSSKQDEWEECRPLADTVLATIHLP